MFVGTLIRWVILPKTLDRLKAMPLFILGLAMSEGCGILGIFLVPEMRSTYLLLAVLVILQFAPFFAARLKK